MALPIAVCPAGDLAGAQATPAPRGTSVLSSFGYRGVSVDGGALRAELDRVREFYLRIPNDDLLKGFRARAGKPAPGLDLGGWYTNDVFHVFGQILSGLARIHAVTADPACREKVLALVHGWGECVAADGYFFASEHPNALHYIYDKMVGGLVDAWIHCQDREALELLSRITDWASEHLSRARPYAFNSGQGDTEWYTLTENLDRAWLATGEARYRDFAQVWAYDAYWNLFPAHADLFGATTGVGAYHAYSHVNTLGGAGAQYLVTGDARYLSVLTSAYDELRAHHTFATGGYGPDEQLHPAAQYPGHLGLTHHSFETQCGSFAALKLVSYLQRFTGEARYGDWAELLAINALAASLENADDGRVFYYSDYCLTGGSKFLHDTPWTCCAGTRPMVAADVCDIVWFHDEDGVYANLFAPSTVTWERGGTSIRVEERTRFPESDEFSFRVRVPAPVDFSLHVRMPDWLAGPIRAELDGSPIEATGVARGWIEWRRSWHDGDQLSVVLPRELRAIPLQAERSHPAALALGPVVLAVRATGLLPRAAYELEPQGELLEPVPGEPLTYHLRADPSVLVRPFYAFRAGEPYLLYLDPALANRIPRERVSFIGPWQSGERFHYSNHVGATAECSFTGTGIRWLGYAFDDAGRARVTIDGREIAIVDQYSPGRDLDFDWRHEGLAPGEHRIRLELSGEKSAASKDCYLNVAGFEVLAREDSQNH